MAMMTEKPITQQPLIGGPRGAGNCPPGLDPLINMEEAIIKQKVEYLEIFTCCETSNRYTLLNAAGTTIYKAEEDSDCCSRNCCGASRGFGMDIRDPQGTTVMHLERPWRPCSTLCCCCPPCLNMISISAPPGRVIGYIQQVCDPCVPTLHVQDSDRKTVLSIKGKCCSCHCTCLPCFKCCRDVTYKVLSPTSNEQVGAITKKWSGILKEIATDADNFAVTFPIDMNVETKALLLGATFLVDFMFYERGDVDADG